MIRGQSPLKIFGTVESFEGKVERVRKVYKALKKSDAKNDIDGRLLALYKPEHSQEDKCDVKS